MNSTVCYVTISRDIYKDIFGKAIYLMCEKDLENMNQSISQSITLLLWCDARRVDYNGRPSDIYQPTGSKTTQLCTEPVKDGRPILLEKIDIL